LRFPNGDTSVKVREVDSLENAIVWELITLRGKTAKSFPPPIAYQFATLQSGRPVKREKFQGGDTWQRNA
jgi:hypothetical protein